MSDREKQDYYQQTQSRLQQKQRVAYRADQKIEEQVKQWRRKQRVSVVLDSNAVRVRRAGHYTGRHSAN